MEANLRTTDLYGVTISDIGFAGDVGECGTGKKEQTEECVEVFHCRHSISTVNFFAFSKISTVFSSSLDDAVS